ncbi:MULTISPECIES: SDR family oxidoreductase [Proteiniphilum]|uniref:SDR family oxidoreductase n=1 Tax=Proteiniphilum TaxID=294702 RepID=UPI0003667D21|nr:MULTISPECIES: SDR family oxidoreductase [Proteiniphilum]RNC63772.1 SDR family oxidoreductase [Proteiniphilum sp. X52]SFL22266.1 hypothetical protein SAMN05216357_115106 [Porphyromonadaceae bacterium KH3CP3RA]
MANKTCLILGSNSDLGEAIAYKFAKEGFDIQLAARKITDYQQRLSADISIKNDVKTFNLLFDGNEFENHMEFVKSLPMFPDVVVSVFGYLGDHNKALGNFNESLAIINNNYVAHVSILNILANIMEDDHAGTIIGISSVAGERGRGNNYIYGSAKAGFTAYLSGLRNRLSKSHVNIITVIPGYIDTKMISHLKTPSILTAQPSTVAKTIYIAYKRKKEKIYVLGIWKMITCIIKLIPEKIFKKLSL